MGKGLARGLPMNSFDNPEVRKTVLMTTECGQSYIRTKPGGVKEPTLPHRTYFMILARFYRIEMLALLNDMIIVDRYLWG